MISCIVKFHISMHKIFDNMLTDELKFRGEEKEGRDDVDSARTSNIDPQ